jgi:hypothetical protein
VVLFASLAAVLCELRGYELLVFYVMDGLLLIPFRDLLGLAFHAYALYRIYRGMQGIPILLELQRRLAPEGAPIVPS